MHVLLSHQELISNLSHRTSIDITDQLLCVYMRWFKIFKSCENLNHFHLCETACETFIRLKNDLKKWCQKIVQCSALQWECFFLISLLQCNAIQWIVLSCLVVNYRQPLLFAICKWLCSFGARRETHESAHKTIVFCGTQKYFPNRVVTPFPF